MTINGRLHLFLAPTAEMRLAIEEDGMTWATCEDVELAQEAAVFLFHTQAVPLSTDETPERKCLACGERSSEGDWS